MPLTPPQSNCQPVSIAYHSSSVRQMTNEGGPNDPGAVWYDTPLSSHFSLSEF
jgi:hypothetical protein